MKKVFAIVLSLLLLVSLSFAVVGCKKAEEQAPAEAPKAEAPAAAPAPAGTAEPAPAGTAAPAPAAPAPAGTK